MRFIDEATISITAGHGGPGSVSFRREKYVPRGGPDGGDGGDGGDIIFIASSQLSTLQDFRFRRVYRAPDGEHGSGANKAGKDGEDITIKVPVGTIIRDQLSGEQLVDFSHDGETWVCCKGGRGGKGNAHFVTSTFQAPKFAQDGEAGEFKELILELKLLAQAAIIGFPNAGKSTLISRISAARPKIADYPFTTLTPNLGVVTVPGSEDIGKGSFVIADIPGLIEGAHRGAGLGHKFLRHIERTYVLVHLLDGTKVLEDITAPNADISGTIDNLVERYSILRNELGLFSPALLEKPEIVALNKLDLLESDRPLLEKAKAALRERIAEIRGSKPTDEEPYFISGVSGQGIQELVSAIYHKIREQRDILPQLAAGSKMPDDEDIRS
jgi:GTP-binding protein